MSYSVTPKKLLQISFFKCTNFKTLFLYPRGEMLDMYIPILVNMLVDENRDKAVSSRYVDVTTALMQLHHDCTPTSVLLHPDTTDFT